MTDKSKSKKKKKEKTAQDSQRKKTEKKSLELPWRKMGRVWLVGAGPGDPGLMTCRGREVLAQADVVVYDALLSPEILAMIPPEAETIDVGKRANAHKMKQKEINHILLDQAREGRRVVRLKGGDPYLFGRGGEEIAYLAEHEVPCEIVPGITSALAVPACMGIPVTHREDSASVHIFTGHRKKDEPLDLDYEAIAKTGGTLIFLMSVASLPDICFGLIRGGLSPDTPAGLLERGTMPGQRRILSTLANLPEEVSRLGAGAPAVLIIGGVCRRSEILACAGQLPLAGCRAIVTRPRGSSSRLSDLLKERGAQVLEIPAIEVVPRGGAETEEAFTHLDLYDWIAFTSPAGVRIFFGEMRQRQLDLRVLGSKKIAVLGPGTAAELSARGIYPDAMPETYDTASLGRLLAGICPPQSCILIPRSANGSFELTQELAARPDLVWNDLALYDTIDAKPNVIDPAAILREDSIPLVFFTSASTVTGFASMLPAEEICTVRALCIGAKTAAAAERLGMITWTAEEATPESLADLAVQVYSAKFDGGQ